MEMKGQLLGKILNNIGPTVQWDAKRFEILLSLTPSLHA
jgi:hypothetical protein